MNTVAATRIARRELSGGLGAFRVFVICLALGVAAIAAIGSVRVSIEEGMKREGAALLGGDAEMQFTYRFADQAELAWIEETSTTYSEIVDFRSMALVNGDNGPERGLTQVKGVDAAYPLTGEIRLSSGAPLSEALEPKNGIPGAVMHRVLVDRLGIKTGDTFDLGIKTFHLAAVLEFEPDGAGAGFALGPRTLVLRKDLEGSGLLEPGTLFQTSYRMLLPADAALDAIEKQAKSMFADNGVRWRDARRGAPGVQEFVERIGSFLVLVGIAGLAVGGVGVSAAVRAYLTAKISTIATLKSLGADRATIFFAYFIQIAFMTMISVAIGVMLGAAIPVLAGPLIESQLPIPAEFGLYPKPLFEAALYGVLTAFLFVLWPIARTEDVRVAALFRDAIGEERIMPRKRYVFATVVLIAALVGAAGYFTGSPRLANWAALGVAGALLLLVGAAMFTRAISRRLAKSRVLRGRPVLRLAFGAIGGPGEGVSSVVLSLGLGLSVLAAVGQIDENLRKAIEGDLPDVAPSYFFVDIQTDQLGGFNQRLADDKNVSRVDTAPMLRGVITRINDRPARDVVGNHWVIEGDRGITYSDQPPANTTLTAGKWWDQDYSGPPQISFAAQEAEEMGLKIGDSLTVNVLGREIKAEITSFRVVDYSNAGISFVMSMNPSALAGAPHSHIATVYAEENAEAAILRDLAGAYPNITAIRVRDAIDNVARVLNGLAAATRYAAGITLVTGFVVLIGAAAAGEASRVFEAAVLKTLGAPRRLILTSFALRSLILGAAAGAVAICAGILAGWAVMTRVMEGEYFVAWGSGLAIILGGVLLTLLAGLFFAGRPLAARPAQVLRSRE